MRIWHRILMSGVLLLAVALGGCAQSGPAIGYSVHVCCPGDYANYATYGLRTQELPGFIANYVISEFDEAFAEKGVRRDDQQNDITVTLTYRHVNLNPEQERIDPFERRIEEDVVLRYVATILVDIRETRGERLVWSGQINRIHAVFPGEYMHEDNARPEFRTAFRGMLDSYPSR